MQCSFVPSVDYWSNCHFLLSSGLIIEVWPQRSVWHGKWVDITILLCFSYIKSDTTAISHATCKKNDLGSLSHDESVLYTTKNVTINCTKAQKKKVSEDLVTLSLLFFLNALLASFIAWLLKKLVIIKEHNEVINKLKLSQNQKIHEWGVRPNMMLWGYPNLT